MAIKRSIVEECPMYGCEECIVYALNNNLIEPEECPECGKKTLAWKQSEFGTPYMECSACGFSLAVDLNTPCELDHVFHDNIRISMESQTMLPDKNSILMLAKDFGMSTVQMLKCLKEGFSVEMTAEKLDMVIMDLKTVGLEYKIDDSVDLREKYHFYKECGYPYSKMQFCIDNDKRRQ